MASEFNMTGMDELLNQLNQKFDNIEALKKKALKKGAEIIKSEMERNLSVSMDNRHVKDFIIITEVKKESMVDTDYILIGPASENNNEFYYARMLEFGTVKMSPRPWAEKAVITVRNQVLEVITNVLKEAL